MRFSNLKINFLNIYVNVVDKSTLTTFLLLNSLSLLSHRLQLIFSKIIQLL